MHSIIKALMRIMIIWAFLNIITYIPASIVNAFSMKEFYLDSRLTGIIYAVLLLLLLIVLFFLWRKTDYIVKKLVGEVDAQEQIINISGSDLYRLLLRIMGIYMILTTIPEISRILFQYFYYQADVFALHNFDFIYWVPQIVKIIIGICLVIGNEGIRKGLGAVRYFLDIPKREN
ncbi:MAG: hypothetical protein Q7T57_07675 [Dehalococcoidales bacterium]|nr:hypothetical protein [Dehalococcoidales bacterium]